MTTFDGKRSARDYFWFALALIVVLIGSASRASAADAAATAPPTRASGLYSAPPLNPMELTTRVTPFAPAATDSASWRSRSVSTRPFRYTT
jgi:hypothetical protein